ncbi:hypothetical protein PshuTeo2_31910 [Pseudomonas hunanensis]|uniref:Uncharacterized protein n=1 Tax=Pseudomonas putida TaxID=303 RepID=A0A2S3XBU1_PSEPU|nr:MULTISPECIES: hypothetical protein [Pseudomonas]MDF3174904.1 hypothetical protein [Pseudomonas sp. ER28]MDY7073069.1 hypothetical protein [Pseudomonas hunanensis]POG12991.1 hypothetical protein BGP82_00600 [Pseudomonas putida]HDS0959236.1 hypothetical protein [Pseudomonas putida]
MLKRVRWVENSVLVVKLDDALFTLAQMRVNGLMEFFDVFSDNDDWRSCDLNSADLLFCIFVAEKRLKSLFVRVLEEGEVVVNHRPIPRQMLSFEWVAEDTYTADLIELTDRYSSVGARVIKSNLSVDADLDVINSHDFCGVFGEPDKLKNRLKFFHDAGVNWDEQKKFIYPSLERPENFPVT